MPTLRYYRISDADPPSATTRQGNSHVNNERSAPQRPAPVRFAEQQRQLPPEPQPQLAQGPKSKISPKQQMREREQASATAAAPAPAPSMVPLPKSGSSPAEVTTTTTTTTTTAAAGAAAAASVRRPGQILPIRRTVQADRPNAPTAATFPTGVITSKATGATPAAPAAKTSTNASARQRKPKKGNRNRGGHSRMPPLDVAQAAPMVAGGAKAASEAAAAYGTAASSVASMWTGSASSPLAAGASGAAASIISNNNDNSNNSHHHDTLLESTLSATPAAQLLGMITPEQASALASMELERRLLLRRRALVGEMTAAGGMQVGPGPRPRPGGIGSSGIGMGVVGGLGGVGSMGVGRPSGAISGHLGGGGPFMTSLAAAAAAAGASANGGLGMLKKPPPPPPPPSLMGHIPMSVTKPLFGRQPLDQSSISAASSKAPAYRRSTGTPTKGVANSEHKSSISAASSKVPADQTPPASPSQSTSANRVPTPPNWVASFELTADVATHAQALSSDLPLDPAVGVSTSVRPIIGARAVANHPFAPVGAMLSNPVAFRQAQMRGLARNNNTATYNLYSRGGFGLPHHRYQSTRTCMGGGGAGGNGDSRSTCSSVVDTPAVRSASMPEQQQNIMSPVDPKAKEATTSPPAQQPTKGAVSTSFSSDDEDGDDSTMGETTEESSPAKRSRSRLKKRPISRPKNGYNFYFRHGSGKMKRRDEIIHIIRKRLKAYKRDTGKGAEHLFSSSFHYPSRINRTTMFAEQWGSDWIVRSGLRYRFQMEAASEQENYRSVIQAWQAAEKFQTRGSK